MINVCQKVDGGTYGACFQWSLIRILRKSIGTKSHTKSHRWIPVYCVCVFSAH